MISTMWKKLFVLSMAALTGEALYFHMGETERKCFIEEIPEQTRIIVNYKMEQQHPQSGLFLPSSSKIGMHVEVKDPQDKIMLSRVYRASGNVSFISHLAGDHVICLYSNATAWFGGSSPLRIHLNIKSGEHAVDYEKVAKKERLTDLQLRARQMLDQVEHIHKEQDYQKVREERFRMTSDNTNLIVMVWALGQTIVLVTMGVWQMMHLKKFFLAKKYV